MASTFVSSVAALGFWARFLALALILVLMVLLPMSGTFEGLHLALRKEEFVQVPDLGIARVVLSVLNPQNRVVWDSAVACDSWEVASALLKLRDYLLKRVGKFVHAPMLDKFAPFCKDKFAR
ncbi:hypothetical protein AVMA1855_20145 [Acidovorax sp. SUPP1855]|uniref:hypothetical protein n=1 Tax=Acidovorax sp. SUPP1855 TaxID=431774 RepID=UPI0023DE1EB9|nr:hypothetical protein [Acidovorax sp. SUPP1855]GKS86503.1 hypothetical protein AVMA1855_20145 [Acidovorax sp. SUPP1855]